MKRILTTLSQKWPEYTLEILVITIGILGAFALNNWNEGRKVRDSEVVILRNLKQELTKNKVDLENIVDQHKRSNDCLMEILNYFEKDYSSISTHKLDSLFVMAQTFFSFEPINGYMRSIISSGKLDNLQNEQLKSMITAFDGIAIDATQEVFYVNKLTQDRFWNRIDGRLSQLSAAHATGYTELKGYRSDYKWILQDYILQDIMVHILTWQNGALEDEEKLKQHILSMIEIVNSELKK